MPIDKTQIKKGRLLTGALHAAEQRSDQPQRGQFMVGGTLVKKQAVSPALADEFADAIAEADRLAAQGLGEVEQRLADARRKLAELRAAVKR